jgi:hypothetical protein
MKGLILLLITFFFISCKSSPTPPKEQRESPLEEPQSQENETILSREELLLKSSFELYLYQLKSLNSNNIIAMTYPKFFTVFSQRTYGGFLYTMINSSNIDILSFDATINKIEPIQKFSKGTFAKVSHNSIIKLYLKNPELYNTESSLNTLYSILAHKYGAQNIHVDTASRVVTIKRKEKMIAIKEGTSQWKFIGDNPTYRKLYSSFLPYDILDKI